MKMVNVTALLITVIMVLIGCATTPKSPDELDAKIREASDYLNERIPKGRKIAIISIQSDSDALSEYIIEELISNAVNDNNFSVVDRQQLDAARSELNFNMSGEVSDQSAQAVGQFTGAQVIVTGRVSKVGDVYRFSVRALEVESVQVMGSNNWNILAGRTINALIASGGSSGSGSTVAAGGSRASGGTASGGQAASGGTAAATPPAPVLKNGTYTLNPRPRARTAGGQWLNMWISKVVVESRFIIFYYESVERGAGSGRSGDHNYSDYHHSNMALYNLDRESVYVMATANENWGGYEVSTTFPRVNFNRFRIETKAYGRDKGFEEIIMPDEPDE